MKALIGIMIISFCFGEIASSQAILPDQEFLLIDSDTYPSDISIAGLKNGNFVLCCRGSGQGPYRGIYGQIFDIKGSPKSDIFYALEFNTNTGGVPTSVAALNNGGFVFCWDYEENDSTDYDLFGQIFDSSGVSYRDNFLINTFRPYSQYSSSIALLKDGRFLICWQSYHQDGSGSGIFAQIFDDDGDKIGNEFQVNTYTENDQGQPVIATLENGDFVICYSSLGQDGSLFGVFAQLFNEDGVKIGIEFQVNTYIDDIQFTPSVAALKGGGFMICWSSDNQDGSGKGIFGQIFNSDGTKRGVEFRVNTRTDNDQRMPVVSPLQDGGFAVCWQSYVQQDTTWWICFQLFDDMGNKRGNEFQVNNYPVAYQGNPVSASLKDGGFIVCWEYLYHYEQYGIYGKFFPEPTSYELKNFSLLEPSNDETINNIHTTFRWENANDKDVYPWEITFDLYIDSNAQFSEPLIIRNIQDTSYMIDSLLDGQTYFWKVFAKNLSGDSLVSIEQDWGFFIAHGATTLEKTIDLYEPFSFVLNQNFPNPFNSCTEIEYSIPGREKQCHVILKIYNIQKVIRKN